LIVYIIDTNNINPISYNTSQLQGSNESYTQNSR